MDLYKTLNLNPGDEVPRSFLWKNNSERFAFKALKDRRYKALYDKTKSLDDLKAAGFFDDGLSFLDYKLSFLTTPTHKLSKKKGVVLLSTGSFSPLHRGHVQMMELAKKAVEDQGKEVIGGYLSPSHDSYVQSKGPGHEEISLRIHRMHTDLHDHPWLMVDPWEGRYTSGAINFTDVIDRTRLYLEARGFDAEVVYVFGSDNQSFSLAFTPDETCVCVQRKSQEKTINFKGNHLWVNQEELAHESSSKIRDQGLTPLSPGSSLVYLIRDDRDYIKEGDETLFRGLEEALRNALDTSVKVEIHRLDLLTQQKLLNKISGDFINLDTCSSGGVKLEVCRNFALADGQVKSKELVARPSYVSLDEQLAKIPAGTYSLVDDDIASGTTMNLIKQKLQGSQILKTYSLSEMFWLNDEKLKYRPYAFYDIIDFRDFLVGSKQGGLVVEHFFRVPYMMPYASNTFRSKILPEREKDFSLALWQLNLEYFQRHPQKLKDRDPSFVNLMKSVGFSGEESMDEVCNWHKKQI